MGCRYVAALMITATATFMAGRMSVTSHRSMRVERWSDTVVVHQPEVMVVHTVRHDTVRLASASSGGDSVAVVVPRQQAEYSGDGFHAWVSGFRPALDSIVFTRSVVQPLQSPKRWSVGIQAGIGITPRGVQPYIGLGVAYNFKF